MQDTEEILALIPHRPPFLWVDRIVSWSDALIVTEKHMSENLDILRGHYPGNPIMPGVLLCEAIFQTAAILMAKMNADSNADNSQVPVLTRIKGAKFKKLVLPGDTARIEVRLVESVATACYFKGVLKVSGEIAVSVDFACKLVSSVS